MPGAGFLADPAPAGLPDRRTLRRAIRHELRRLDPSIRVVAEDLLTETTTVDLVGRGARGELVAIRIGRGGDDDRLLTGLLADRAWLAPRLVDWCKLAPELDLDPDAGVRGLLVCPDFQRETCSAATLLPEQAIGLIRYHCLPRQYDRWAVLLESVKLDPPIHRPSPEAISEHDPFPDSAEDRSAPPAGTGSPPRRLAPSLPADGSRPRASAFRTGLTDADLRPASDPLTRAS
jgi:hypothetical protein